MVTESHAFQVFDDDLLSTIVIVTSKNYRCRAVIIIELKNKGLITVIQYKFNRLIAKNVYVSSESV